jgi:hypothetical protein
LTFCVVKHGVLVEIDTKTFMLEKPVTTLEM